MLRLKSAAVNLLCDEGGFQAESVGAGLRESASIGGYRHGSRTEYDAINNHRDLSPWAPGFFLTDLYAPSIMAAELVLVHA
ncbi:hypothetical protein FocTR4_00007273 [Fusarium oxysporum f. sp. cubense]|uniref:Uncharacterized protein n=1 Tax=Fusarium oxysporum f. sp. cubense TaxID=61366 RepID=A0A5C6TM66_FUSOC|nr:hypothetical protein FocTR4_00007273 [Fusarium oxysporum f. sp. cubense]